MKSFLFWLFLVFFISAFFSISFSSRYSVQIKKHQNDLHHIYDIICNTGATKSTDGDSTVCTGSNRIVGVHIEGQCTSGYKPQDTSCVIKFGRNLVDVKGPRGSDACSDHKVKSNYRLEVELGDPSKRPDEKCQLK